MKIVAFGQEICFFRHPNLVKPFMKIGTTVSSLSTLGTNFLQFFQKNGDFFKSL